MNYRVVQAQEVKKGNRVYSNWGYTIDKWITVKEVKKIEEYVVIITTDWETWKHPMEAIAIKD